MAGPPRMRQQWRDEPPETHDSVRSPARRAPDDAARDASLIRVRPRHAKEPSGCPLKRAMDTRPGFASSHRPGPIPLGRVMDVLDVVEFESVSVEAALARV